MLAESDESLVDDLDVGKCAVKPHDTPLVIRGPAPGALIRVHEEPVILVPQALGAEFLPPLD